MPASRVPVVLALAAAALLCVVLGWRPLYSPDVGFYLSYGRSIAESGSFPFVDALTFTRAGAPIGLLEEFQGALCLSAIVAYEDSHEDVRVERPHSFPFRNASRSFARASPAEYGRVAFSASIPKTSRTFRASGTIRTDPSSC